MSVTKVTTIERGVREVGSEVEVSVKKQLDAFLDYSNNEKVELFRLNGKMSSYIERVRHLENENTNLLIAISNMQANWGEETRKIRDEYEQNLLEMRGCIDEVSHMKTIAEVRNKRAAYENGEYEYQLGDANRLGSEQADKISNLERLLKQMMESHSYLKEALETEVKDIERFKNNRDLTWNSLVEVLDRLDDELFKRITVEYGNQTLREQIEFTRQINEREIIEMEQLGQILPFNEQVEFYKDQLKRVISNIRKDYEQLHLDQTREMEEWMSLKRIELENMNNKVDPSHELEMSICMENIGNLRENFEANTKELDALKRYQEQLAARLQQLEENVDMERQNINSTLESQEDEVRRLHSELEALTNDCNHVNVNKATLEYEINVYKRLLDSQLDQLTSRKVVESESVIEPTKKTTSEVHVNNDDFGGNVKNKQEKKGPVGISDSAPDGAFIQIENDHHSDSVDISGWTIRRKVDRSNDIIYTIPRTVLGQGVSLKIWAKSFKHGSQTNDLNADFESWGVGMQSLTRLIDNNGIERSFFEQNRLQN